MLARGIDRTSHLLVGDRSGAVMIFGAIALAALTGFAGLAVDAAVWETSKLNMQGAADAAAYSAAIALAAGSNPTTNAKGVTAQMGLVDGQAGVAVAVNRPPTQGKYAGNSQAIEVIVSAPEQTYFSKLYLSSTPIGAARAVALRGVGGSSCVLALDGSASGAVSAQGSTQVDLAGCNLQVDSSSSSAVSLGGNSALTADALSVDGGYTVGSSATLSVPIIDSPGAPAVSDPYAGVSIPAYSGCDHNNYRVNSVETLQPGVYCKGLTFDSNAVATLSPGVYIIDRGSFTVNGGAVVTGTGVTIILTSSTGSNYATVTVNGSSTITLSAPTSGDTAGLVFYEDRNAPSSATATLNGGANQSFTGALYFPSTNLTYSGNSSSTTCTQLVADTVTFTGNSTINSSCAGTGVTTITSSSTMLAQ